MLRIHGSTREQAGADLAPEAGARGCGTGSPCPEEEAGTSVTPLEGASEHPARWVCGRGGRFPWLGIGVVVVRLLPATLAGEGARARRFPGRAVAGSSLPGSAGSPISERSGVGTPLLGLFPRGGGVGHVAGHHRPSLS